MLTRPRLVLHYAPHLVLRGALEYERTQQRPRPEVLAEEDEHWREDIDTMLDWLKFHRDFGKRPPIIRDDPPA